MKLTKITRFIRFGAFEKGAYTVIKKEAFYGKSCDISRPGGL